MADEQVAADLGIAGLVRDRPGAWTRREVLVRGDKIVAIAEIGEVPAQRRIDTGGAYLLPGAIDSHVHTLSHPGEGITATTVSAAAGGVTTIVDMPFDEGGMISSADRLSSKCDAVEAEAVVDVALLATLAPHGGWSEAQALVDGGACGFKLSLFDTDPVRFPRIDDAELLDAFSAIAALGVPVCVHAENNEIVKTLITRLRDEESTQPQAHTASRPPVSETQGVLTALEAAHWTGARLHLCHLTLPRSVELVRRYVADGLDVTAETCPHYLTLTEEDLVRQHARLKINPPLRSEQARLGLWESVIARDIDIIGSDHAPWPLEYKTKADIFANHSGAPGVETLVPMVLGTALSIGPEALDSAVDALTVNPANRFGLGHRKGRLWPGYDADVIAFDAGTAGTIDESALHSNAGWSPYHGLAARGRITLTVSRGRVAWDGGQVLAAPGWGSLVTPNGVPG